jgi:hypothetical protein
MKLTLRVMALLVLVLVAAAVASADDVTLKFTGATANGEYGPYSLTVNGGPTTPMICFSDKNWITGGESWSAQAYTIGQIATQTTFTGSQAQFNELGYLADELFAHPGNSDLQLAIWSVFGLSSPFAATSGSTLDLQIAYDAVNGGCASNGVCSSGGYVATDVLFYIPDTTTNLPTVNGTIPQPFISQVPEPSSLVLLVSGMVALMLLVIRRGKA